MTANTSVQVAVLAGGQSRRMGQDKSFVLLNGKPLIEHVLESLKTLNVDIIIITNKPGLYAEYGIQSFTDIIPNSGSLGGLYTALEASHADYVVTVACDMPFLNPELLNYLLSLREGFDVVVPVIGDTFQSLHAVYARQCRIQMRQQIEEKTFRVSRLYESLNVRRLEENELLEKSFDLLSFSNLNTPQDLAEAYKRGSDAFWRIAASN
jgi:molybdenum cofactor guanylyltransferase